MANQKQKEKKKKNRERIAKERVVHRREVLHKQRKIEKEKQRNFEETQTVMHGKVMPIVTNPKLLAERDAIQARTVADRLKQNLQILEALEQEYEAEQATRAEMNDKLEAEGHKTMREKMDALHQKALQMTGKAESLAQAQEECAAHQNIEEEIVVEPII